MKTLRIALALLLVFCGAQARATTFATDVTDLWWNPNEGGWGVNVSHQDDTLFLTFFVYGANGNALWYSASDVRFVTSLPEATTYTGALFQTTGPYLGGAFDPRNVSYREVGTATFIVQGPNIAVLTYTVDGVTVNKALQRYTFRVNNMSGIYRGVMSGAKSGCAVPASNGPLDTFLTSVSVSHNGSNFSMQTVEQGGVTCTYSGGYSQTGRLGLISGAYSCSDGRVGPFQATEMEANTSGFIGRFGYSNPACTWSGRIAGVRP